MTVKLTHAARPTILSRALLVRFVSIVASSVSFFLPLAVVPAYAEASGTAATAGLATAVLLFTTVACELATPRIVAMSGYRWGLAAGLLLLGAPALLLVASDTSSTILVVSALRGAGFAVTVVAGGALTAALIPPERRGAGLAVVGLVSGVPSLLALPAGVWMAQQWGYGIVFTVTAVAPLLALVTIPALPARARPTDRRHGTLAGLRTAALNRPAGVFAASAAGAGVLATFLPLAVDVAASSWVVPAALFAQFATATAGKWLAGRLGDRRGHARLLPPGVVLSVAGMAAVSLTHSPVAVLAGAVVFGAGFGVLQNASLTLMYARVTTEGYSTVSAIWNAAYDAGMATGALGVGLLVPLVGYPAAFLTTAVLMAPALVVARRQLRARPAQPAASTS